MANEHHLKSVQTPPNNLEIYDSRHSSKKQDAISNVFNQSLSSIGNGQLKKDIDIIQTQKKQKEH
jgi:hypothetical protein